MVLEELRSVFRVDIILTIERSNIVKVTCARKVFGCLNCSFYLDSSKSIE